jgi:hypothetical protein
MVTDTLEALFDMRLAVPPGVVRCLVEGADGALGRYAAFAALDVGSAEALIPPRPPLTRQARRRRRRAEHVCNARVLGVLGVLCTACVFRWGGLASVGAQGPAWPNSALGRPLLHLPMHSCPHSHPTARPHPIPSTTARRYKREIAVAAEEADSAAAVDAQARAGGVGGRLRGVKGRLESAMSGSWLAPLGSTGERAGKRCVGVHARAYVCVAGAAEVERRTAPHTTFYCTTQHPSPAEDEARVMYTPLPTLVVRANSVQHVEDALPGLRAMVIER